MAIRLAVLAVVGVLIAGACSRAYPDLGDDGTIVAIDTSTHATDDAIPPTPTITLVRYERVSHVAFGDPPLVDGRAHDSALFRPPRSRLVW